MHQNIFRKTLALLLSGTCLLSTVPIYAMDLSTISINLFNSDIDINVNEKEKIDLIVTKGESDIDLTTFKDDIIKASSI